MHDAARCRMLLRELDAGVASLRPASSRGRIFPALVRYFRQVPTGSANSSVVADALVGLGPGFAWNPCRTRLTATTQALFFSQRNG